LFLPAFIGFLLWFTAQSFDFIQYGSSLYNSILWQVFALYHSYAMPLMMELGIEEQSVLLFLVFIPFVAMYLGIRKTKN
jgi:hypothetical protein